MIKVFLTEEQRQELERFRSLASNRDSEKALMVLLNSEGESVAQISQKLKRNPHTVRDWLKRYIEKGIQGLKRNYSPGRPDQKRSLLKDHIQSLLPHSPLNYGYQDAVWSVLLITHDANQKLDQTVSQDTVKRALKDLGYSYKRPSKTVPARAPSKEEKIQKVACLVQEIQTFLAQGDTEIYALDESHFSSEPYLVRGWFKKRNTTQNRDQLQKRKSHVFWVLKSGDEEILLEKIRNVE